MAGLAGTGRMALLATLVLPVLLSSCDIAHAEAAAPPPPLVPISTADPFAGFVAEAAKRFGIPAGWIRAVMRVESDEQADALSPKGAMGLMQVMPGTYQDMQLRYALGADPYDPRDNIMAGAAYLREMYDRYGAVGFLAAYNAGPARYEADLTTGQALPAETQRYMAMLAPLIGGGQSGGTMTVAAVTSDPLAWTQAPLFVGGSSNAKQNSSESGTAVDRLSPSVQAVGAAISHSGTALASITPQSNGLFIPLSGVGQTQ